MLLEYLAKEVRLFKDIYVVGIYAGDPDNATGDHVIYTAGDLNGLAYASLLLADLFQMHLHGQVIDEFNGP